MFHSLLARWRQAALVPFFVLTALSSAATAQEALDTSPIRPTWMADGARFWFSTGSRKDREVWVVDPRTNEVGPLFDTAALRASYEAVSGKTARGEGLPFSSFELEDDDSKARFRVGTKDYEWRFEPPMLTELAREGRKKKERKPKKIRDGIQSGEPPVLEAESPDGRWFATIEDHNAVLLAADDSERRVLTEDGFEDYAYDMFEARWSPDSSRVAVLRSDKRELVKIPVMKWLDGAESVEMIPYSKPHQPLEKAEWHFLGVNGTRVRIDAGDNTDTYFSPIGWRPDGAEFFLHRLTRDFKRADLLAADPETGKTRVVLTETYATFLEPTWTINIAPSFQFLKGGEQFLWISEAKGWNHLYLYDSNGELVRQLTDGELGTVRVIEVDDERGWVYFSAHGDQERPYDTQIWRVGLGGEAVELISSRTGVHDFAPYLTELGAYQEGVSFSPSLEYFVATFSTALSPPRTELRSSKGELIRVLAERTLDESEAARRPETFVVLADDGETELHGVLYAPSDLDPSEKYPVVDYIYNGPQTTWVPHTFGAFQHMVGRSYADKGFVCLIVDGRGTTDRGKAFQDFVYGNFGRYEIPDHVATIRQLAESRPWMDLDRVGVTGGSFGGYMTLRAMLMAPDFYKVGVSVAPVASLEDVIAAGAESYMGLPENDPEGYEYASCINKAGRLKGELLIIHGSADVNAPFGSTVKMVDALMRAGKDFEFVMLPDEPHWPTGRYGNHVNNATMEFLVEHLNP